MLRLVLATLLFALLPLQNMAQVYKAKVADFDNVKASVLGEFVPAKLGMDNGERPILVKLFKDAKETDKFVFIFEQDAWYKCLVSGIFHAILSVTILWQKTI